MSIQSTGQLQKAYDEQYKAEDTTWRDLGALGKARNIIELCGDLKVAHFLDVGSGDGAVLKVLDEQNFGPKCTSLEISDSGFQKIKGRKLASVSDVLMFDGYKIPLADKQFKLATCSHVIEHVEHPRILLREIHRVSELQYFEVPIDFSFFVDEKVRHYLGYGHINIFTPALFKFLLKSEGFEVVKEKFIFYDDAIHESVHKGSPTALFKAKLKNAVVEAVPFFRKIKPNAFGVLTRAVGSEGLKIF